MYSKTVSSVLRGIWAVNKEWADSQLPLVLMMLQGKPISFVQRSGNEGVEQPFLLDPATMQRINMYVWNGNRMVPNPNVPPNCIGVIPITGPITKYNGDCGEPGMITRSNWLMDMQNRDNVCAIIQLVDTPGGEAYAANTYCALMQGSKKPIITYIDGMCASLGMWFAAASDEVYFSNEIDKCGSIGTYCTLVDWSGYLEKEGIKLIEIYAPQSTDKNGTYKEALAGDISGIQEDLKVLTSTFISHVSNSRGAKAADNINDWNSGKMFYAKDAIKIGLADGIMPLNRVVSKAVWLSKRNKN